MWFYWLVFNWTLSIYLKCSIIDDILADLCLLGKKLFCSTLVQLSTVKVLNYLSVMKRQFKYYSLILALLVLTLSKSLYKHFWEASNRIEITTLQMCMSVSVFISLFVHLYICSWYVCGLYICVFLFLCVFAHPK